MSRARRNIAALCFVAFVLTAFPACTPKNSRPSNAPVRPALVATATVQATGASDATLSGGAALATSAASVESGQDEVRPSVSSGGGGRVGTGSGVREPGSGSDARPSGDTPRESAKSTGYLIIKYWNDTVSKEPDLLVTAASASWRPRQGVAAEKGKLGPVPLGRAIDLVIYPDGASGKRIVVPVLLSASMDSNDLDAVHIEVRDNRVRILGNPVQEADVVVPRS